jgi:tetratricopeptide (TPR) repeat protein
MDAFISYRRKPSASLALLLQTKLKADYKIDAYVDTTRTDSTQVKFPERLMQAIVDKKVFVCLLGEGTLDSEWVLKEIEQAFRHQKRCIPVFQESYAAPTNPSEAVNYLLSFDGVHIFDLKNVFVDEAVSQLARLIKGKPQKQRNPLLPVVFVTLLLLGLLIGSFFLLPFFQANPTAEASDIVFEPSAATDEALSETVTETPTNEATRTSTSRPSPTALPTLEVGTARNYYNRGIAFYSEGNFESAIVDYTRAIELDPDFPDSFNNRGAAYFSLRNYEAALLDYNRAIELKPDYTNAFVGRGITYTELGDYESALADFNHAIELDPNNGLAYSGRASSYYRSGRYENALADYLKAEELGHSFSRLSQQRFDELRATVTATTRPSLTPSPTMTANQHYQRGRSLADSGNYQAAVADYTRAIELDPNDEVIVNSRGVAYYNLEEYDLALADYNRAIELDPNYVNAHNNRGIIYRNLEEYDLALADYTRAIELDPNHVLAYVNRGNVYKDLEEYDLALADYNRAIELDPNYASAYNNRGDAYYKLGNYQAAFADFNRAIELDPNYATAYNNRGWSNYQLSNYEAALADWTEAVRLGYSIADATRQRMNQLNATLTPES